MKKENKLNKEILKIDKLIEKDYGINYIPDGIVDVKKFLKAKYKILWILKEPHAREDGVTWDMRDLLKDAKYKDRLNSDMVATFTKIIYSSYGILNEFKLWKDIEYINNNLNLIDVLKEIALININKLPAGNISSDKEIDNAFLKHKNLINNQIEVINPDIIIGGNTIENYMYSYFKLNELKKVDKIEFLHYYPNSNRILIDAWHPANRKKGLTQEKYCDGIINAAKDWVKNYKV